MKVFRAMAYWIVVFVCVGQACGHCEEGQWTPETLLEVRKVSDVQVSPDGKSVLTVVRELDESLAEYGTHIYLIPVNQPNNAEKISSSSRFPRWSPDGKKIAYISGEPGSEKIYVSSAGKRGGSLLAGRAVQNYKWSPDSQWIVFVEEDPNACIPLTAPYQVSEDDKTNRLWLVHVPTKKTIQLTDQNYHVRGLGDCGNSFTEYDWSPDSARIVFAHSPATGFNNYSMQSSLAIVDVNTQEVTKLPNGTTHESCPRFSPDGKWIAYLESNTPADYFLVRHVAVRGCYGESRRPLGKTIEEGPYLQGLGLIGWTADSENVLLLEPKRTKFQLYAVPLDGGEPIPLPLNPGTYHDVQINAANNVVGYVAECSEQPPEAFMTTLESFDVRQVSEFNRSYRGLPVGKTERVQWESPDGIKIEGFLTYPEDYQKGKRYPLILVVHGGPMAFFFDGYLGNKSPFPLPIFAQNGVAILRCNPRGSCGYGLNFRKANFQDWGGGDFEDLMAGVDFAIEMGVADPDRLGIMGWSYGGYMTAWAITQTERFSGAIMGAGLANLTSMDGTTDLHQFLETYFGQYNWEDPDTFIAHSPLFYVQNVTTPCLLLHGSADKRVPIGQSCEFFQALQFLGVPSRFVAYPDMPHGPVKARDCLDVMQQHIGWFEKYLSVDRCCSKP